MNKKRAFMGFVFFDTLLAGILCGYFLYGCESPMALATFCFLLSLVSMFVGMVLAFMNSDDRMMNKKMLFMHEVEANFEERTNEAIRKDREIYGAMSVEMAKAVADRVANRVVSKHVGGMDDDGVRQSILASVNAIVEEEIGILHEAMRHEAGI